MARENQGLQIALIVFVMLTIILGATTYLFYKNWDEAFKEKEAAQKDATNKGSEAQSNAAEVARLKEKVLGLNQGDDVNAVFAEDMKKFGGAYSENDRHYRPLVQKLAKTLDEKNADLVKAKAEIQEWDKKYVGREASKDPQIKTFTDRAANADKELTNARSKFDADRARVTEDQQNTLAALQAEQKTSKANLAKIDANLKAKAEELDKLTGQYKTKSDKLNEVTAETFDAPEGEVRWVNQRNGAVWINLGRADGLARQVSFSVYPADITNFTTSSKKASIEVTQILGDHLAEARVTDDSVTDPIMPGDKINTPLWSPGERKHFALTGFIDLDQDGKSDLQAVIDLIALNGGVVDCSLNDKGEINGEMTAKTRYLVRGERPDEKGAPALLKGTTEMANTADRLGIQEMRLADLLEQSGWKNLTPVVHYDRGANPKDFPAKPTREGKQKTAPGNVFIPREPPKKAPNSAY